MKSIWKDNHGEGHLKTAVIIIASIVVGALILGGVYALFHGQNGVVEHTNRPNWCLAGTACIAPKATTV